MDEGLRRRTVLTGAALGAAGLAVPGVAGARGRRRERRHDVVVVGGGMSGLYAARTLRAAGRSVLLLEAGDRLGGRVVNLRVGPGPADVMEGGAQWISPKEPRIQALMRRYRLKTYQNDVTGKSTLSLDGQVSTFDGIIAPLPEPALTQLLAAFNQLTPMAATVPLDAPWTAPRALEWDAQTAQSWIDSVVTEPGARALLQIALGGPVSVQARDISLLHYLFIAQSCGGPFELVTPNSGVLSDRVVGGTGALVAGLARELRGAYELESPATLIEHGRDRVRVTTPHGRHVAADVVVAMAPTMTQQLLFDPMLPVPRVQAVQRTGNGSAIKFFPVYETPFWRAAGRSGYAQAVTTGTGAQPPFGVCFDNSPPGGRPGVLFCLTENEVARGMSAMSQDERKRLILEGLAALFGEQARHPIRFVSQDWDAEPWIRGGAASFFPPGLLTEYRTLLGDAVGRVHFAGTESGTRFWGNMESALETGERAAREILGRR